MANFTERNRLDIITVATQHFSDKGFAGARVDEIAAATATSKRMIYYHFGSKEGLYRAVLTQAYRGIRSTELDAGLDDLAPLAAIERLTALTFDYHFEHPELVRLVMDENIRGAPHVREVSQGRNEIILPAIERLIARGIADGSFRPGLDAIDLHMTITALAFYFVSNRHTFHILFGADMTSRAGADHRRAQVIDNIVRYCRADPGPSQPA